MGRKLDLSSLSNDEAEHVLRVLQRDMQLRQKEEERLSEMKQELEEEGTRCSLLCKQHKFNEHCCIRCCTPFTFLLNPKRPCLECHYNICKSCCTYSQSERGYICASCQKSRLLRTQALEWFYNNVKSRFNRCGSAKVLKTLYRKHIIERGALSELPEVSAHEGSNDNGSVCDGSDSTIYKQSEGNNVEDTLTVALRVAEEAIEEAIAKAESYKDSLEKQNEARYLRDHREELVEELATTIVQKIIQSGKRPEIQAGIEFVWPQNESSGPLRSTSGQQNTSQQGAGAQIDSSQSYPLWMPRSVFSLTSDDSPEKDPEGDTAQGVLERAEVEAGIQNYSSLRRESRASSLPGWKSVYRLDNSSASSVLQSPDGNWIALQSSQHSRPSLLTKRKSLVFSVLEKESGVVSAYDEMGLDSDPEDQGGWGAALLQFRRRLSDETYYTDSQHDPEWTYTKHPPVTSPSSGQYTETLNSDSDTSPAQSFQAHKPQHSTPQRKQVPFETQLFPPCRRPPGSASGLLDVNFNPRLTGDSSDGEDHSKRVKRSRRRRKSKHETSEPRQTHPSPYSTATMENSVILLNAMMMRRQQSQETPVPLNYQTPDTLSPHDLLTSDAMSSEAEPPEMSKLEFSKPELCLQGPFLKVSAVHKALREDLKFKVCDLVGEDHEKDARSNYFEEISEAGIKREDRTRRIESEKLRFKKRHESKTEIKSKGERQTVEQMDTSNVTRQINMEREIYRERDRQKEIEKQLERERERQRELENQIKSDREKQRKIEIQVERKRERQKEIQKQLIEEQERQLEIEREIEKKRKSIRIEKENIVRAKSKEDKEKLRREQVEASGRVLGDNTRLDEDGSETQKEKAEMISSEKEGEKTKTSMTSPTRAFCALEKSTSSSELITPVEQKNSAATLCSITTEVLKFLNATEELLEDAQGSSPAPMSSSPVNKKLDQQLTKMEENVYLAAGALYSLEGSLSELEHSAKKISSGTSEMELTFLEDQVATAAAQVQLSELKVCNIEARISALKTAGLDVSASTRFAKNKSKPMPQTLDSSRHQRRKLPAPPLSSLHSGPSGCSTPVP